MLQGQPKFAKLKASGQSAAGCTLRLCPSSSMGRLSQAGGHRRCHAGRSGRTSGSIERAIATVRFDSKGENAAPGSIVYSWRDNTVEVVAQI